MPVTLLDLSDIDLDAVMFCPDDIEAVNPHRGVMRLLDGVIWQNEGASRAVAYKDIRDDEFWVPGHIPGRPLFPGVLMLEAAAQLASFMFLRRMDGQKFLGFTGIEDVRFRGQVVPGHRLYILGEEVQFKPRRCICQVQGQVEGKIVFDAKILGMPF